MFGAKVYEYRHTPKGDMFEIACQQVVYGGWTGFTAWLVRETVVRVPCDH